MPAKQEILRVPEPTIQIPQHIVVGKDWGGADLHFHTRDVLGREGTVFEEAARKGIIFAITEHDYNGNFDLVGDLAQLYGLEEKFIAGAEITVLANNFPVHLLIYFPDISCVPSERVYRDNFTRGVAARDAIKAIHEMGGFAVWPHATSPATISAGRRYLEETRSGEPLYRADGLEVLNASPAGRTGLINAKIVFEEGGYAAVGGSDGRDPKHLGFCLTRFPGRSKEEFIKALKEQRTVAQGSFLPMTDTFGIATRQVSTFAIRTGEIINGIIGGKTNGGK